MNYLARRQDEASLEYLIQRPSQLPGAFTLAWNYTSASGQTGLRMCAETQLGSMMTLTLRRPYAQQYSEAGSRHPVTRH